ncbi:hypothetical protein BO99DRAFT_205888 [Aspergillus violaceofuscus CBS 115571]|uniref:Uncharacterized protein n=1 Tax=Aspergillus violaceofuscus (strain CBS 115571) TaxID=1450538 RepID=A0A2V5H678_ASPV1|nr:hypothetical protein BO99DRAFT_205888 [Aspergillus violaceofuscus CBS 115571]
MNHDIAFEFASSLFVSPSFSSSKIVLFFSTLFVFFSFYSLLCFIVGTRYRSIHGDRMVWYTRWMIPKHGLTSFSTCTYYNL